MFSSLTVVAFAMAGAVIAVPSTTTRVSVSSSGAQGNTYSVGHALSANGRYVAFGSGASNLVPNDTNGVDDVFLRDVRTRTTTRISASGPSLAPSISADGRYVAYVSTVHILVYDQVNDTTTNITGTADGASADPAISGNGRYITFSSAATNLVPDDTNRSRDVFVHDLQTHVTTRVSLSTDGQQGNNTSIDPAVNRNGRYVTYYSTATNLVAGDTNEAPDVFVRDLRTGTTTRVSVSSAGGQANGWGSFTPDISADGRRITFMSNAGNIVVGDTNGTQDIFLRDQVAGTTTLVSLASSGVLANESSDNPVISADGTHIAFTAFANNLVAGDTNEEPDVFVRDLVAGTTIRVSSSSAGVQGNGGSSSPAISTNGARVAFVSHAANLVSGDTNAQPDIFLHIAG